MFEGVDVELFDKTNSQFSKNWNLKLLVHWDVADSVYFAPYDEVAFF
jgi:hypothetical protein